MEDNKPPEPPDPGLASSTGPSNEPTTQAHSTVSQPNGDSSHPTSPVRTEHGESAEIPVEAHSTVSQESDISSLDPHSLLSEQDNPCFRDSTFHCLNPSRRP